MYSQWHTLTIVEPIWPMLQKVSDEYAKEVLSLGLLWECFHDAIKEGDGKSLNGMEVPFTSFYSCKT